MAERNSCPDPAIGKGGVRFFTSRAKVLEKCDPTGGTRTYLVHRPVQAAPAQVDAKRQVDGRTPPSGPGGIPKP